MLWRIAVAQVPSVHMYAFSNALLVSAALVRAFGPELAEVPLLATRHELQGNSLGPLLLHTIQTALLKAGVKKIILPALHLAEGPLQEPSLPPGQTGIAPVAAGPLPEPALPSGQFGTLPVAPEPGIKPWGILMGYKVPLPAALLEACKCPMLQLPGTPYLMKQLTTETITKVLTSSNGARSQQ